MIKRLTLPATTAVGQLVSFVPVVLAAMASNVRYEIEYDMQSQLGAGGYGQVYQGRYRGSPAAVKVVIKTKVNKREEQVMKKLNHENVVKLLHAEDHEENRCYALELCDASLDQLYLETRNPKKYDGPMPSDEKVILQLAFGLEYIHSKGLVHRDIKPANVLIQQRKQRKSVVLLKWADFGLSKPTTERGTYSQSGVRGTLEWMAPEVLELMENNPSDKNPRGDVKSDVFATGCLFFWLLTKGLHPFGVGCFIPPNILQKKVVNLEKLDGHIFRDIIISMIQHEPNERIESKGVVEMVLSLHEPRTPSRDPGPLPQAENYEIKFDRSRLMGRRSVFLGTWRKKQVAVKLVASSESRNEENVVDFYTRVLWHPNLVRIHHVEDQLDTRCFAIEPYGCSLDQLYNGDMRTRYLQRPTDNAALFQLANGLKYLHSKGCVHGHIKPSNILVDPQWMTVHWTGFMHDKPIGTLRPTDLSDIETHEYFWLPPEILKVLKSFTPGLSFPQLFRTKERDVFATGCLFLWFLSGRHPFDTDYHVHPYNFNPRGKEIEMNILMNRKNTNPLMMDRRFSALVTMICENPSERPTMQQIVNWLSSDPFISIPDGFFRR